MTKNLRQIAEVAQAAGVFFKRSLVFILRMIVCNASVLIFVVLGLRLSFSEEYKVKDGLPSFFNFLFVTKSMILYFCFEKVNLPRCQNNVSVCFPSRETRVSVNAIRLARSLF